MKKVFLSLALLIVLMAALPGVMAQEEDEAALYDRALAALQTYYDYNNYTVDAINSQTQDMTINLGEQGTQDRSNSETMTGTFNVIRDIQNISGTFTIESSNTEGETTTEYVVEGEMRYVDGVLYINAAYTSGDDGTGPEIEQGWQVIEDVENHPIFSVLDVQDTIENFAEERQQETIAMFEALREQALSVTVSEESMSDDSLADVITISLDPAGLLIMMSSEDEEVPAETVAMLELLPPGEEIAQLIIAVDADGNVRGLAQVLTLNFVDADLATLMTGAPEGSTFSLTQESFEVQELTNIGGELEPATVPAE